MNNYDLYLKFIEIAAMNSFDSYIALKQFKKEYKKSEFYKQTHMPISVAYKMFLQQLPGQLFFKLQELTDVHSWAAKLTEVLNNIDEDAINNLIDKFTSMINMEALQDEKGELKIALNNLKDLIK
jgi:hypothetical protein